VNGTFFSFETNANLNVVIKEGKVLAHNTKTMRSEADTNKRVRIYNGAIGIAKNRTADVAWVRTDSTLSFAQAVQFPFTHKGNFIAKNRSTGKTTVVNYDPFQRWKVETAIGGGPVLLQKGEIKISNNEEGMFAGKAIHDKHPRTAMGYTKDNKLIILVVEGRNPEAGGATLTQEAQILKDLGCVEALNLDGGGSSCLLINGKETIAPSDKRQRPVPAVFMIHNN
jgi:exopolysaccharide biosynthesis protein